MAKIRRCYRRIRHWCRIYFNPNWYRWCWWVRRYERASNKWYEGKWENYMPGTRKQWLSFSVHFYSLHKPIFVTTEYDPKTYKLLIKELKAKVRKVESGIDPWLVEEQK